MLPQQAGDVGGLVVLVAVRQGLGEDGLRLRETPGAGERGVQVGIATAHLPVVAGRERDVEGPAQQVEPAGVTGEHPNAALGVQGVAHQRRIVEGLGDAAGVARDGQRAGVQQVLTRRGPVRLGPGQLARGWQALQHGQGLGRLRAGLLAPAEPPHGHRTPTACPPQ